MAAENPVVLEAVMYLRGEQANSFWQIYKNLFTAFRKEALIEIVVTGC